MPRPKVLKTDGTTEVLRIIKNALETKQDVLTIDSTVSSSSDNPVKNSGIYNAIQNLVSASYANSVLTLTAVNGTTTTVAIPELDDVLISASYDTTTHELTLSSVSDPDAYVLDLSQLYNPYTFADKVVSGKTTGFTVTDSSNTQVYEYVDPSDESDGSYPTSSTLSTTIGATTSVAIANISGIDADEIVIGETLVYDAQGTVGNITAKSGTNVTVTTMTCAGHTIQDDTGTDMAAEPNLQFVNTKVTDDSTNGVTKVEVEKLTQADIDEIVDDLNYNPGTVMPGGGNIDIQATVTLPTATSVITTTMTSGPAPWTGLYLVTAQATYSGTIGTPGMLRITDYAATLGYTGVMNPLATGSRIVELTQGDTLTINVVHSNHNVEGSADFQGFCIKRTA